MHLLVCVARESLCNAVIYAQLSPGIDWLCGFYGCHLSNLWPK